jgi:hypothetical protein
MSSDGLTFTFVPDGPLGVNRGHSINMNLGRDLAGNQQNGYSLYFATTFASDTTPPSVVGLNPVAGSTGVPRNVRVEVRFSESVSAASLGNVRLLLNGSPVSITRTLSNNNRLLTLRPTSLLASNRTYTISIAGVRDTGNNVMAAPFTSSFSTGSRSDLISPTVTGSNPVYNDYGVGVNALVRMTFSEPIDPLSVTTETFIIYNPAGGAALAATLAIAADRRSVTLTPSAPLLPFTQYYAQLSTFYDVAGNAGSGYGLYFVTGAGVDTAPPLVTAISPPNGTLALPVNTRVTVVMNEPIDPLSVSNASIQLTPAVAGTVTLATDRVTLTFVPSANVAPSTAYVILVSGLRDTTSNTMAAAAFGFTTAASSAADTTAPTVIGRTPTNSSAGVGVTSLLTITTSERITAAAVGPDSVPVYASLPNVGTFQLAGQYSVDSTGTVITFAVTGAFPANATIQWYTNYNSTIRDMAGLLLPNQFAQFTTANVPDTTGPTVVSVTPTSGATNVGQYATIALTFSESVNPISVSGTNIALYAGSTRLFPNISRSTDNRMVFLSMALPLDQTMTVFVTSGVTDLSGNPVTPSTSTFRTSPTFDITNPRVITQRPTGSTVALTSPITLFLSKPIDPATVPGALFVAQNGVLITGTVSVGWSNQAITFTPATPFAAQAVIEISLTADAKDSAGNALQTYYGSFVTAIDPAAAVPTLVRTNPVAFTSGNPTNSVLDLEYSEPINPASVSSANVYVRDAANQPVDGTLSVHSGNRVVRFTLAPQTSFAQNNYNYFYYSGLTDPQGASIAAGNFYFYTGAAADTTTPTVLSVTPAAGSAGIGVNGQIRVNFSEPMNTTTLNTDNIIVSSGGAPLATTFTVSNGNRTIAITPQLPFPPSATVTITITGVQDVAGHAVPTTSSSFTTSSTLDITAPALIGTSVAYGDTAVPVNSVFEWTYSEPIDPTLLIDTASVLYDHSVGAYIPGGELSVSADGRTVTYVPPAPLTAAHQYSVNFGNVVDLAGNVGGGGSLFFTTASVSDEAAPQILAANPEAGATGVPLNARIRIAFDEAVSAASLQGVNVLVSGLPLPVASRALSNGDRVLTVTLSGLLAPSTFHTVSVNLKDRAGNTLSSPAAVTFTTGTSVDLISPSSSVTASPADGATGVAVGVAPSVTFSEPVDPTSVIYNGTTSVGLVTAATNQTVPVVYSFSADRRTVIMTPVAPLAAGTQYRMFASSSTTDVTGNVFPTTVSFLFTTQP